MMTANKTPAPVRVITGMLATLFPIPIVSWLIIALALFSLYQTGLTLVAGEFSIISFVALTVSLIVLLAIYGFTFFKIRQRDSQVKSFYNSSRMWLGAESVHDLDDEKEIRMMKRVYRVKFKKGLSSAFDSFTIRADSSAIDLNDLFKTIAYIESENSRLGHNDVCVLDFEKLSSGWVTGWTVDPNSEEAKIFREMLRYIRVVKNVISFNFKNFSSISLEYNTNDKLVFSCLVNNDVISSREIKNLESTCADSLKRQVHVTVNNHHELQIEEIDENHSEAHKRKYEDFLMNVLSSSLVDSYRLKQPEEVKAVLSKDNKLGGFEVIYDTHSLPNEKDYVTFVKFMKNVLSQKIGGDWRFANKLVEGNKIVGKRF